MAAAGGLAFAAAMGMIDRIHGHAAHRRPHAAPAIGAGLAERAQVMFGIRHHAHGRAAFREHLAHFARAQAQSRIFTFPRHELYRRARTARDLGAFAWLEFDAMNGAAERYVAHGQAIAGLDR